MIEAKIYTQKGKETGNVKLPEEFFSLPWNDSLLHQVVVSQASNERDSIAHTKTRSEVRGGGKKPWRQKGTGRARHGSTRSPIWTGGGVTFGPRSEKNYSKKINRKMNTKAFFIALSQKAREDKVAFIDSMDLASPSTKEAKECVEGICNSVDLKRGYCSVVFTEKNDAVKKSFSNLKNIRTFNIDAFNALNALSSRVVIFVNPEDSMKQLSKRKI